MLKSKEPPKLTLIGTRSFQECEELYRVVDFLNKMLKHKKVLFGLTKDSAKNEMTISIYET
ncbi:MAG: YpmA family protein [Bacillota bacterium]